GGYGWGDDRSSQMVTPASLSNNLVPLEVGGIKPSGYVAGFQAGGNWQSGKYVGGLEIDLSATGIKGSASASGLDNAIPPAPWSRRRCGDGQVRSAGFGTGAPRLSRSARSPALWQWRPRLDPS